MKIKNNDILNSTLMESNIENTALVFDIDNTLRDRESGIIPETAIKAINDAHEKGYKIYIATGRSDVDSVVKELIDRGMCIDGFSCANGQRVLDGEGNLMFSATMDKIQNEKILELANKYEIGLVLSTDKGFILTNENIANKDNIKLLNQLNTPYTIDNNINKFTTYNYSLIYDTRDGKAEALMKEAEEIGLHFKSQRSSDKYFDVVLDNVTKSTGIDILKEKDNVSVTICFGDAANDKAMFEHSNFSFCMGNGQEEAKKDADAITEDLLKDGISKAIDFIQDRYHEIKQEMENSKEIINDMVRGM